MDGGSMRIRWFKISQNFNFFKNIFLPHATWQKYKIEKKKENYKVEV